MTQPISANPSRHAELGPFDPRPFAASPLYTALCELVRGNEELLDLAGNTRAGQQPEFALFGAVHYLLLRGADDELARYYPSVVGADALAPDGVAPAFVAFCAKHRAEIVELLRTRLVQTNQVRRAVGLRTALAAIAPHVSAPIDLVEVGCSAGLLLGVDRYGFHLRRADGTSTAYGDPASPVQLTTELRGTTAPPDLDVVPAIASRVGIDLAPVDPTDAESRAWLEALVWPEDDVQRRLLSAALQLVADSPPPMLTGDAVDVLPELARTLPRDHERVVLHCATRMHQPADRLAAFDSAIASLSDTARTWRIAIEYPPDPDPRPAGATPGAALQVDDPDGTTHLLAVVDGHLRWLEPVECALVGPQVSSARSG